MANISKGDDFEVLRKKKIDVDSEIYANLPNLIEINARSAEQELEQPIFNVDNFKLNVENLVNMTGQGNGFIKFSDAERKKILRNVESSDENTKVAARIVVPAEKNLNRLLKVAADKGNIAALDIFIESTKEKENSVIGKLAQHYKNKMDPEKISEFKTKNDKAVEKLKEGDDLIKKSRENFVKKNVLDLPRFSQKGFNGLVPGSRGNIIRNSLATIGLAKRKPHKEGGKGR